MDYSRSSLLLLLALHCVKLAHGAYWEIATSAVATTLAQASVVAGDAFLLQYGTTYSGSCSTDTTYALCYTKAVSLVSAHFADHFSAFISAHPSSPPLVPDMYYSSFPLYSAHHRNAPTYQTSAR